jgi:hypothetical protein
LTQIGEGIAALFGFGGPAEPGSLEVTVVERKSGEPVGGVVITLRGPTGVCAVTGPDGKAHFSTLEPGPYLASATQVEFEIGKGTWLVYVGEGEAATMSLHITRIMLTTLIKRIPIGLSTAAWKIGPGHWWTEIDGTESYGWYPAETPDPLWRGYKGVPGRLNGGIGSAGTPTEDAHHGDTADEMFHPRIVNGDSAAAIKACIRTFARGYTGTWSWPDGQNCHTFQEAMMEHCGLAGPSDGKRVWWLPKAKD